MYKRQSTRPRMERVTIETLASGETRTLAKFVNGRHGLVFTRLSNGTFGVLNVIMDADGRPERIVGVMCVQPWRVSEFDYVVSVAKRAYETGTTIAQSDYTGSHTREASS
jgi:hypothetical protein